MRGLDGYTEIHGTLIEFACIYGKGMQLKPGSSRNQDEKERRFRFNVNNETRREKRYNKINPSLERLWTKRLLVSRPAEDVDIE